MTISSTIFKRALFFTVMMICSGLTFSYEDKPFENFDTRKNFANKGEIVWRQAEDVNTACERESRRIGNNGFGYAVQACSFWFVSGNKTVCTIITGRTTNLVTLGHELRHCFQGEFH
jgi:hypothetical protein